MNADVRDFLDSNLLEEYFLGQTDSEQSERVASYIQKYSEVAHEYEQMQLAIEAMADDTAIQPPPMLREQILSQIDLGSSPVAPEPKPKLLSHGFSNYILAAAASIALLMFAWNYNLNQKVSDLEYDVAAAESANQRLEAEKQYLIKKQEQLDFIADSKTKQFLLKGNQNAPDFELLALWNEETKSALVKTVFLPPLPKTKCYQMWADVDGKMISVGVLKDVAEFSKIEYLAKATSLNVTVEDEGGSDHPDVSNLVSSIAI